MEKKNEEGADKTTKVIYVTPQTARDNDEIDLRELFQTLIRKKLVVIVITVLAVTAALIYIYTKNPVFESRISLSIGTVRYVALDGKFGTEFFENPEILVMYLNSSHKVSASLPIKGTGYISITANAGTPEDAERLLLTAVNDVLDRHEKIYSNTAESNQKQITLLNKQIEYYSDFALPKMEKDLESLYALQKKRLVDSVGRTDQNVEMGYLLNELITGKESEIRKTESLLIPDLEMQKLRIQEQILEPFLKKTILVGEISTPSKAVEPKKKRILIISLFAGLMLGVFAVFFLEFLKPKKAEHESSEK